MQKQKLTRSQIKVGDKLWYSSFGTKDFAIIEVVGNFKTISVKRGIFSFEAKILDNSNWSVADRYDWSTVGNTHRFNNCFVSRSYEEMCGDVEAYKKVMCNFVKKKYELETGKKFAK